MIWKTQRGVIDLSRRAQVMGILNVTPDSFSDGGRHWGSDAALAHARQMIAEGAMIIDVGGESTRPGAMPVSVRDEIARTIPVIAALRASGMAGSPSIHRKPPSPKRRWRPARIL